MGPQLALAWGESQLGTVAPSTGRRPVRVGLPCDARQGPSRCGGPACEAVASSGTSHRPQRPLRVAAPRRTRRIRVAGGSGLAFGFGLRHPVSHGSLSGQRYQSDHCEPEHRAGRRESCRAPVHGLLFLTMRHQAKLSGGRAVSEARLSRPAYRDPPSSATRLRRRRARRAPRLASRSPWWRGSPPSRAAPRSSLRSRPLRRTIRKLGLVESQAARLTLALERSDIVGSENRPATR